MCLAVPGKITELHDEHGVPMARVDFAGISREVCMAYLPEARPGEYVVVHVGFAISRVNEQEVARTLADHLCDSMATGGERHTREGEGPSGYPSPLQPNRTLLIHDRAAGAD